MALHGNVYQRSWILAGDLNVMADTSECTKYDGSQMPSLDIKDFTECLQNIGVFDNVFTGPQFTWSNKQGDGFMARKLDRVLINSVWLHMYAQSTVEFLPPGDSNHCAAYV